MNAAQRIEPVGTPCSGLEPNLLDWLKGQEPRIRLYAEHFEGQA